MEDNNVLTVSQLNAYIKRLIESNSVLKGISVVGEISNFKAHSSGHLYFGLKDGSSFIKTIMFKSRATRLKFKVQNGQKVVVKGNISVYERDGQYQLYADSITPFGVGDLYLAFEQLKELLNKEGLFLESNKKKLPLLPRKIGVVTSPTGAVWHDIQNVATARFPGVHLILYPASVQGEAATPEVIAGIEYFNNRDDVDVLIVGRGGGSLEDLWAFNTEPVARAIFNSRLPIISAVGHETDFTIADMVADKRAATPSQAAEFAVPSKKDLLSRLDYLNSRMGYRIDYSISKGHSRIDSIIDRRIFERPEYLFRDLIQRLDMLEQKLFNVANEKITEKKNIYKLYWEKLSMLSPLNTLDRGYSLCTHNDEMVLDSNNIDIGDKVKIQLSKGGLNCIVESKLILRTINRATCYGVD